MRRRRKQPKPRPCGHGRASRILETTSKRPASTDEQATSYNEITTQQQKKLSRQFYRIAIVASVAFCCVITAAIVGVATAADTSAAANVTANGVQRHSNSSAANAPPLPPPVMTNASVVMTATAAATMVGSTKSSKSTSPIGGATKTIAAQHQHQSSPAQNSRLKVGTHLLSSGSTKQQAATSRPPAKMLSLESRAELAPSALTSSNAASENQLHKEYQQQNQPQQQQQLEGYAYDGGYTHVSRLSPARIEMRTTEARTRAPKAPVQQSSAQFQLPQQSSQHQQQQYHHLQQQLVYGGAATGIFPSPTSNNIYEPRAPPDSPVPLGHTHNPCKPPQLAQQPDAQFAINTIADTFSPQQQLVVSKRHAARFQRVGAGLRLRSQFIFKVLRVESFTDCELQCALQTASGPPSDACRSFNYRPHFGAENCELSRLDLRALRLNDSSQFEPQNTFDFYAIFPTQSSSFNNADPLLAGATSNAALIYGGGGAQHQPLYSNQADCMDVAQHCSLDGIEFTLRTGEPFTGRIYAHGFYDSCFALGAGSTQTVLRLSRANGFPRCGTQQIGDLMTNIVVVQFNDFVQTTRDKKYNLTCTFSGPAETVVTSNYFDTKLDERSQPMQVEHLPLQNVITSNVHLRVLYRGQPTNTIAVGDLLTFRLESRSAQPSASPSLTASMRQASSSADDSGINSLAGGQKADGASEIFASNVIAKDPYTGRQVQLIDSRGCPIDAANVFPELQRTPDGALEAEFYAFKIPDSNFLIFQATVRTCKAPCEPVICNAGGSSVVLQPPTFSQGGGVKGASSAGSSLTSAPMMAAPHSVPSWGRRRRSTDSFTAAADDLFGEAGEAVEHLVPARLATRDHHGGNIGQPNDGSVRRSVVTLRKPENFADAEEEVREMFRVFASRDEISQQQHQNQFRAQTYDNARISFDELPSSPSPLQLPLPPPTNPQHVLTKSDEQPTASAAAAKSEAEQSPEVCLSEVAYYSMLFSIISICMLMLSAALITALVSRKATTKFNVARSIDTSDVLSYPISFTSSSSQRLTNDYERHYGNRFASVFNPSSFIRSSRQH